MCSRWLPVATAAWLLLVGAAYRVLRLSAWLQIINPSETFGEILVGYNHVECTAACMTALTAFKRRFPGHREAEVARALRKGLKYLKR